jgi:hypothetical protein
MNLIIKWLEIKIINLLQIFDNINSITEILSQNLFIFEIFLWYYKKIIIDLMGKSLFL